jgi:GH15 family glucan-1,4-alpha-glucosidase
MAKSTASTAQGACANPPIRDYAIIGDGYTAALVSCDGSIDWWCWPRFDSAAVFCRLLDWTTGGYFQIVPVAPYTASRAYVGPTNVLATTFETDTGRVCLTDFMPARPAAQAVAPDAARNDLLRLVQGLDGEVELEIRFRPTFDYARALTIIGPWSGGVIARDGSAAVALACPVVLGPAPGGGVVGRMSIRAGERRWLGLMGLSGGDPPADFFQLANAEKTLDATLAYWRDWSARCTYHGPYRDLVVRSALALKLLTFEPTGALVAAPTTSLPEQLGGVRNWDYRYTWLRDSALILEALVSIGYTEEARAFFGWLQSVWLSAGGHLQIMYSVDGQSHLPEQILGNLNGYCHSVPVRIGNAAATQVQLDIFGEVLDAAYFSYPQVSAPDAELWSVLRGLANQAADRWQQADSGLWEVRAGDRPYLYSKLLCWVAVDRAIRLSRHCRLDGETAHWQRVREQIRATILQHGYNPQLGAFTQTLDGTALDASVLMIPILGFLPATDPRVRSTVEKIRERLMKHGLVYRYLVPDGLPDGEATFVMCSFWMVDCLALAGEVDQARRLFEHVVGFANDVGLLSEEIDPVGGMLLGNFPQGFSHLALIRSALYLARAELFGAEHQAQNRTERFPELKAAAKLGGGKAASPTRASHPERGAADEEATPGVESRGD